MAQDVIVAHEPVVTGWFSHANQFGFEDRYRPADGIEKCLVGTPPILSLRAVLHGIACFDGLEMGDVAQKSRALSELLIDLADDRIAHHGFTMASPREPEKRGSQVSFRHPEAYAVSKALRAAGVVADFRSPDILRFGITPLYMRYVDVWDAVEARSRGSWLPRAGWRTAPRRRTRSRERAAICAKKCGLGRRGVFPDEALTSAADQPGLLNPDALLCVLHHPSRSAGTPCRPRRVCRIARASCAGGTMAQKPMPMLKTRYISASSISPRRWSTEKTGGGAGSASSRMPTFASMRVRLRKPSPVMCASACTGTSLASRSSASRT